MKALGKTIVLEPIPKEKTLIITPDTADKNDLMYDPTNVKVVACGPDVTGLSHGMTVTCNFARCVPFPFDGKRYLITDTDNTIVILD